MSEAIQFDPFDPKKIYEALIERCKNAKLWEIKCIIDESWVGIAPFDIYIVDGIFHCKVIAPTLKDAYIAVANKLPVIKFIDSKYES
jgi:hypothetical protein